ncbi:PREDICTED: WD repeat, SAM and U-box domain-containing protein 1-like [Priapulus caudatus]|uniref:WD repeat, SAM and U-box domain-containing protein 1-like n=1 Tax=Priapulus caudatus TaxID=37621 RepID=A0ABM1EZL9_PRICU|nr:PREDICTED: WD repeat, SAM and U-box domain-containing protein 1-like [Priapulus caudatus]
MHLTASIIATITVHMGDVNGVAFSGDKLATGSGDKKVRLFSMDTWKERAISPLQGHTYYVNCVAFSPFGAQLASCSTDGKCILWDPRSGTKIAILEHPSKNGLRVCTFSPNGATLATAGDDETIALWDTSTRTITRSLVGHEAWVTTCDFTPDSTYLISGSTGGELRLWDARYGHGKCLVLVKVAHDLGVTSSQFSSRHGVQGSTVQGSVAGEFLWQPAARITM